MMPYRRGFLVLIMLVGLPLLAGCRNPIAGAAPLPTLASLADPGALAVASGLIPPTFTPPPTSLPAATAERAVPASQPTATPLPIPTNTPYVPTATPTHTPTPSPTVLATPTLKPRGAYSLNEPLPIEYYPRPVADNGWGVHWIPTVKQEPGVVDHFVAEAKKMHVRWVVFLQEPGDLHSNDYLVDKLVAAGIMPVMRLYRYSVLPYDGDIGALVRHYMAKGVLYYQLYNEPNVNDENREGVSNPNQYALSWAAAARAVMSNGGYPGIGALSPGGAYNHYEFLERTLLALKRNGDIGLLNRGWVSVHNYHGLRQPNDPDGFLLFRRYDEIVRVHLGRSLPMIGTEGGSYHPDPQVEKEQLTWQYRYMANAEPYFFAFSAWLLANEVGGGHDSTWEWQSLFRRNWAHPFVTDFLYHNER